MALRDGATQRERIGPQAVGAYGEKAVEAELLRRGWIATNVNASIKNAADFDIFALKKRRAVQLRVKTCGPGTKEFQFSFRSTREIVVNHLSKSDFTVLVGMGTDRRGDFFFIVPTRIVREVIDKHRATYLAQRKRDGGQRKDTGQWALRMDDLRSGEERANYGLARKWEKYKDNWSVLENAAP